MKTKKTLAKSEQEALIKVLQERFEKNKARHKNIKWEDVRSRLEKSPEKLWSLLQMEETGGEPDVVSQDKKTGEFVFFDCAAESPKERRSICYDKKALDSRKENKPKHSAMEMASEMGTELLNEEQYKQLQQLGEFDTKTSSWLLTPLDIRSLGGAIFGDKRYKTVFVYHNGAESYYAGRGFRSYLKV